MTTGNGMDNDTKGKPQTKHFPFIIIHSTQCWWLCTFSFTENLWKTCFVFHRFAGDAQKPTNDCARVCWGRSSTVFALTTNSLTRSLIWLLATGKRCGYTWKILNNPGKLFSDAILPRTIQWYHLLIGHIWHHRFINITSMMFYQPPKVVEAVLSVLMPCALVSAWCPWTLYHVIHSVLNLVESATSQHIAIQFISLLLDQDDYQKPTFCVCLPR
jgi:hypothetical protein